SDRVREQIEGYMREVPCPACHAARLRPASLAVTVGGQNIYELGELSIAKAAEFLGALELSERDLMIAEAVLKEVNERLRFLLDVGLNYLSLNRSSATLAGGEAQRIRLASQIGSGLVGVLYVLDEPSIGLHQRDNHRILDTLVRLRDLGNTEIVDKVINIDQSPIGRTPRSNPATYTGVFDKIRTLFASSLEAKVRGYLPGRFSFNVKGGRCEACAGDGTIKIEMHFLPDVYVPCEVCKGARYNRDTLDITFKGKNIAEILDLSCEEGVHFFENQPAIARWLQTLVDVGLGYVRLGQPA